MDRWLFPSKIGPHLDSDYGQWYELPLPLLRYYLLKWANPGDEGMCSISVLGVGSNEVIFIVHWLDRECNRISLERSKTRKTRISCLHLLCNEYVLAILIPITTMLPSLQHHPCDLITWKDEKMASCTWAFAECPQF